MIAEFSTISVALDALSLVIMLVIIIGQKRDHVNSTAGKLYYFLVWLTTAFIVVDMVFKAIEGMDFPSSAGLIVGLKTLYFILNALIMFSWVVYVDQHIFHDEKGLIRRMTYYLIPCGINLVLVIVNLFVPTLFSIGADNQLHFINWGIWLYTIINYVYVVHYLSQVIISRKRVISNDFWAMLLFCVPALICSVIQIAIKGLSLICGYAVSALVVYAHLQNVLSYTDGLTGILNRRSLTDHLLAIFKSDLHDYYLSGIMLDVDSLKRRNDTYGHIAGDDTLISIANIMSVSVLSGNILARYAGDEFIIVVRSKDANEAAEVLKRIEENRIAYNQTSDKPYKIEFSVGVYTAYDGECATMDEFLQKTDQAMYTVKNQKRAKTATV